jgi:hypothetical protein
MHRLNHHLTDEETCVNVRLSPALFAITINDEPAYIVHPETTPKDVCELRREAVELFHVPEGGVVAVGDCLMRLRVVGSRGTVIQYHLEAGDVVAGIARVENEMDVKRIETAPSQLAVF